MLSKALEAATPTLGDVAKRIGLSYHTLRSYRLEARTAPADAVRKLTKALRAQAQQLAEFADRLDAELERNP